MERGRASPAVEVSQAPTPEVQPHDNNFEEKYDNKTNWLANNLFLF